MSVIVNPIVSAPLDRKVCVSLTAMETVIISNLGLFGVATRSQYMERVLVHVFYDPSPRVSNFYIIFEQNM